MVKPGLGFFQARRRSSGNVLEEADPSTHLNVSPSAEQGSFRVLSRNDIEKAKQEKQEQALKKTHEKTSKFGRFSAFGSSGKVRTQSIDEDSPSSSKRDSKSSSGTQSFTSRPYHPGGSSSTLPSSAESDPNDNMFAGLPSRPHPTQHNSSPALSMGNVKKQLPPTPASRLNDTPGRSYGNNDSSASGISAGRARATTSSSYASTAIAPKLEADLDFGDSGFDDLFSGLDRKESPETTRDSLGQPGRSLLQGRRTFQSEPIKIDRKLDIDPPPKSWDSRGSGDHLITSPDEDRSPPPVPPHKYPEYAPVASHSPELNDDGFEDEDAKLVRQSVESRKSFSSPEKNMSTTSLSAAMSNDASYVSTSSNNSATSGALRTPATPSPRRELAQDEMLGSANTDRTTIRRPLSTLKENIPSTSTYPHRRPSTRRVMTAAEFQLHQKTQIIQTNDDSSEDDYEDDEEDVLRKQEEQQRLIRKQQQMRIAREHMRRSTAPTEMRNSDASASMSNGFPSEVSLQADEWSDEDIPLGVLAQHGFPGRNKPPTQPANPVPSYFRSSTPSVPDRPSSTGALGNRASTYRPPFARNLPDDPFPPVMGNGLVRPSVRESMGFNNRAMSVYNEPMGGIPLEAQPQYTSLIDQIQMRDNAKQKYMGGASSKMPAAGPFTGALSGQMNAMGNPNRSNRMSVVPPMAMNGMPGMNPMMMNMMGGGQMQMPMMGFPMYPQNELMMQQMYQQQQMMAFQAQNAMFAQQQMPQDPRMSMMSTGAGFQHPQQQNFPQNPAFLGVGNGQQRPMSIMSVGPPQTSGSLQSRPYSTIGGPGLPSLPPMTGFQQSSGLPAGYTPSIAPSERSNIGLSARYRPVVTGNGMGADSRSTIASSMTLQASGGAADKKVKGILKNKSQGQKGDDEEEDWGKIAEARKSKFLGGPSKGKDEGGLGDLGELVRGIEGL